MQALALLQDTQEFAPKIGENYLKLENLHLNETSVNLEFSIFEENLVFLEKLRGILRENKHIIYICYTLLLLILLLILYFFARYRSHPEKGLFLAEGLFLGMGVWILEFYFFLQHVEEIV